jgi:hypothetical protein
MLEWLHHQIDSIGGRVTGAIKDAAHVVASGLGGLVTMVFGRVTTAWHDMTSAAVILERAAGEFGAAAWGQLHALITHWIPAFAMTAWWWVTHPEQLARTLGWHIVAFLESHAEQAAQYLAMFALHLIRTRLRSLLTVAEHVITAVL